MRDPDEMQDDNLMTSITASRLAFRAYATEYSLAKSRGADETTARQLADKKYSETFKRLYYTQEDEEDGI